MRKMIKSAPFYRLKHTDGTCEIYIPHRLRRHEMYLKYETDRVYISYEKKDGWQLVKSHFATARRTGAGYYIAAPKKLCKEWKERKYDTTYIHVEQEGMVIYLFSEQEFVEMLERRVMKSYLPLSIFEEQEHRHKGARRQMYLTMKLDTAEKIIALAEKYHLRRSTVAERILDYILAHCDC